MTATKTTGTITNASQFTILPPMCLRFSRALANARALSSLKLRKRYHNRYHAAHGGNMFSLLQEGLKHDGEAEKRPRHSLPSGDSVPRGVQHGETLRHAEAREVLHGDVDSIVWNVCWGCRRSDKKGVRTSSRPRSPTPVETCQRYRVTERTCPLLPPSPRERVRHGHRDKTKKRRTRGCHNEVATTPTICSLGRRDANRKLGAVKVQQKLSLAACQGVAVKRKQAAHGVAERIERQQQPAHFQRRARPAHHSRHLTEARGWMG